MRQPKFRGINKETGEWCYGFGWYETDFTDDFLKESGRTKQDAVLFTESGRVLCDIDSMGECTGLKDKNGREIYEGDIVKGFLKNLSGNYYEVFGSIIFAEGFGGYGVLPISQTESENSFVMIAPKLEIIGNIHEHPHLLQEELK